MPKSLSRKPKNSYHHGDLSRALLNAAVAEVEKGGPDALSLTALAKKLGVSQPAPYRHFADREALLAAVAVEGFRVFIAALKEAVSRDDPESKVVRCVQAYVNFGLERHGFYRLMFASGMTAKSPPDSELFMISQESFQVLVDTFDPALSPSARARMALRVWVAAHGIVMLTKERMLRGGATDAVLDQLVKDCVTPPN
jgi:AcrR family transcriptional regulator